MTDPQETSENVQSLAHSDGQADELHRNEHKGGSDVGGPATTTESGAEKALTDDGSTDDASQAQSHNPL
jgi:hypothetical protein